MSEKKLLRNFYFEFLSIDIGDELGYLSYQT